MSPAVEGVAGVLEVAAEVDTDDAIFLTSRITLAAGSWQPDAMIGRVANACSLQRSFSFSFTSYGRFGVWSTDNLLG